MSEWLKEHAWKACVGETLPWVRIPLSPPFCFPGTGKAGDLQPRPECAPEWRGRLFQQLKNLEITLVIGQYAQAYHLPDASGSVTSTVQSWREYWPRVVPLPHPSPRNNFWLTRNPWLETELLPRLRTECRVEDITASQGR